MFSVTQVLADIDSGKYVSKDSRQLAINQIRMLSENAINPTKAQRALARTHIKKLQAN